MTKNLRKDLVAISRKLKILSKIINKIITDVEKIEKLKAASPPKKKTKRRVTIKPDLHVKFKKKVHRQMIQTPINLDVNKKNLINKSYSDAISLMGYNEQVYVFDRIDDIVEMFINSKVKWKSQLGHYSKFLKRIYKNYFEYYDLNCPGWLNLDDDLCLECGEDAITYEYYKRCSERKKRWNEFGGKFLDEEKITEVRSSILAALFYLCNPYDVIPDYTPGIGFIDDAYVINMALKLLKNKYRKLFDKYSYILP